MQKPFDYPAFIERLRELLDAAQALPDVERNCRSDVFQTWRHEVEELVARINRRHGNVNSLLPGRMFRSLFAGTAKDNRAAFDSDLRDTLRELELVVNNYDRFGDPTPERFLTPQRRAAATETAPPAPTIPQSLPPVVSMPAKPTEFPPKEKVTIRWLIDHMPLGAWLGVGGLVLAAFGGGMKLQEMLPPKPAVSEASKPVQTSPTAQAPLPNGSASSPRP